MAEDFSFSIEKNLGTLGEGKGGWNLELNLVSWGGRPAKYDLRSWSPDHQKMERVQLLQKKNCLPLKIF